MENRPRTIAYCMQSVARTARQATGAWPITCPPFTAKTFPVELFLQADLIWLGLHGTPDNPDYLYGDEVVGPIAGITTRVRALHVADLAGLDLSDKVVFATSCYLPSTNFPAAFKAQGATVIGGPGKNYGDTARLTGADRLGAAFLAARRAGLDIVRALNEAKRTLGESRADTDAREFGVL